MEKEEKFDTNDISKNEEKFINSSKIS